MSGNARGKLKEEMEGIHRDFDWISVHCQKGLGIIGDTHPELQEYFNTLLALMTTLDEMASKVYGSL